MRNGTPSSLQYKTLSGNWWLLPKAILIAALIWGVLGSMVIVNHVDGKGDLQPKQRLWMSHHTFLDNHDHDHAAPEAASEHGAGSSSHHHLVVMATFLAGCTHAATKAIVVAIAIASAIAIVFGYLLPLLRTTKPSGNARPLDWPQVRLVERILRSNHALLN